MRRAEMVLCLLAGAAVPSVSFPPPEPAIRFPTAPAAPPPRPAAPPAALGRLAAGQLYVIDSDVPVADVLVSPEGLVNVTYRPGPVTLYGVFADGSAKPEFRDYKGKHIFLLTAGGTGSADVFVVPEGAKKGDTIRKRLDVDDGTGPRPPPDPTPPGPKPPDPKPPGPAPAEKSPFEGDGFRVLVVFESGASLTPGQHSVIYGRTVRDYLTAKCAKGPDGKTPDFRIYDKDVDASGEHPNWQRALARPRKTIPWVVLGNSPTNWEEGPVPGNVPDAMNLFKKYGGP